MTIVHAVQGGAAVAVLSALVVACSSQPDSTNGEALSDLEMIQATLDEAATRLLHNDKAVLYDMEFEYYTDEFSFDVYRTAPLIRGVISDSIVKMEVLEAEFFEGDSALVSIMRHKLERDGSVGQSIVSRTMYKHHGRWIAPTLTTIDEQLQYEAVRDAAIKAAEEEEPL